MAEDGVGNGPANGAPHGPRIILEFLPGSEGQPSLRLEGAVTPSQLVVAARWLERLGTLQIDQALLQQLRGQGPRVVVPR